MSLRSLVLGLAALVVVATFAAGAVFFMRGLSDHTQATSVRAVQSRGEAFADYFASALAAEWEGVQRFASGLDLSDAPEILQARVDGFSSTGDHLSWAGVAGQDGRVLAATQELLVDESVAGLPWFQNGLNGPFAGDVHEAVLLPDAPGGEAGHASQFIDFSAPVMLANGEVGGVFGVQINWHWVQTLLEDAADTLYLDVILTNRSGDVLYTTFEDETGVSIQSIPALRSAALGVPGIFRGEWPDGEEYFSFAIPEAMSGDVPPFGWALVARLNAAFLARAEREFGRQMLLTGGLFALGGLLAFGLVISFAFSPLTRLVHAVGALARGEDVGYAGETRAYREVRILSDAMARLQARRK
ncbi:cache domain-containing protein [Pelagibacterium xiamenense]|uniref:cache domain-containing protein n=1 Tax=Pelagibacterium xiamenense TaxID=2901140 RepID=UPI001E4148F3|nr:cache domain-containing protein [Pelagibacterium xiamenense]MCD7060127.1 cache domain-containing protein [Pelagibacterium xiamenense]